MTETAGAKVLRKLDGVSSPFFFSSRRRHTRCGRDWSSDVCSSDLQLFTPKIDRLVFAATKIDLVLSKEHETVRQLLSNIVRSAYRHARSDGISPICEAVAAVRATNEEVGLKDALVIATPSGKRLGYIPPQ